MLKDEHAVTEKAAMHMHAWDGAPGGLNAARCRAPHRRLLHAALS